MGTAYHVWFVTQVLGRAVFSTEKKCRISEMYDPALLLLLHKPEYMRVARSLPTGDGAQ